MIVCDRCREQITEGPSNQSVHVSAFRLLEADTLRDTLTNLDWVLHVCPSCVNALGSCLTRALNDFKNLPRKEPSRG